MVTVKLRFFCMFSESLVMNTEKDFPPKLSLKGMREISRHQGLYLDYTVKQGRKKEKCSTAI